MMVSLPLLLTHRSSSGRDCLRGSLLRAYWIDFSLLPSLWRLNKIFKPVTESHRRTMKANRNGVAKFLEREEKETLHFFPPPSGHSTSTHQWCKEWRWNRNDSWAQGQSLWTGKSSVQSLQRGWTDTVASPPGWLYYESKNKLWKGQA